MAYGLPIVTTRWRSIPEMLPENYPGLIDPQIHRNRSPSRSGGWRRTISPEHSANYSLQRFTLEEQHLTGMAAAIRSIETL